MFESIGSMLIYFAVLLIVPLWAQAKVQSAYRKYSKIPTSTEMTGAEVARKILDNHGLYHVTVEEVQGTLSDHYDPKNKAVRLSSKNYHYGSMAANAVAAHEVGHAIQDAEDYAYLRFRHALFPVASLGSNFSYILIFVGFMLNALELSLVGIVFMAFAVLFQIVTLPVEFDASNRAMNELVATGIIRNDEERATKKVLNAAALTYVAATLVAVMELARFILMFLASRD